MLLSSSKSQDFEKFNFFVNWSTRGGGPLEGTLLYTCSFCGDLNVETAVCPLHLRVGVFSDELILWEVESCTGGIGGTGTDVMP
jgi:hypothetical protein